MSRMEEYVHAIGGSGEEETNQMVRNAQSAANGFNQYEEEEVPEEE